MSDLNAATGLKYDGLDSFKIKAQEYAAITDDNLRYTGCIPIPWSRGESAYLFRGPDGRMWGHVHEGLGTKNLVADATEQFFATGFYEAIAQDTVAMGVNDLLTLGLRPIAVSMHLSVADDSWFQNKDRCDSLAFGWEQACNDAMCAWSCGETPGLADIIVPGTCELSCSVIGVAADESHLMNPANIQPGDAIMFLESSGIHANGLTMARNVAKKLPQGYATQLGNGRTYGEALLTPTIIYAAFMRKCQERGIIPHYAVNVTGHGFRKLGRAKQPFHYVIDQRSDPVPPEFSLIQKTEELTDEQMYAAFNMGVGFVVYVRPDYVFAIKNAARDCGIQAWEAGHIEASSETHVILTQLGIDYSAESLQIRK